MSEFRRVKAEDYEAKFKEAHIYRKTARLHISAVEVADRDQEVVTYINGKEETRNTAKKSDYIITGPKGERYVITKDKFHKLYEIDTEDPNYFRSKNVVRAIQVKEPTEIVAPWGEIQRVEKGGYIVQSVNNPSDVYLIDEDAFKKTYTKEEPGLPPRKVAKPQTSNSLEKK